MSKILFTNNAKGLLADSVTAAATSITLQSGHGALFPAPGAGELFKLTMKNNAGLLEIAHCTARSGDTLTIVRGQEGTAALEFVAGNEVSLRVTRGSIEAMSQRDVAETIAGQKTFSQPVVVPAPTADTHAPRRMDVVRRSGDTMTGPLVLSGAPTLDLHPVTNKHLIDTITGNVAGSRVQTAAIEDLAVTAAKLATGTPERDWVLARNAGAGSTVVGAYTIGWNSTTTNIARDGTLAGSSIRVQNAAMNLSVFTSMSNNATAFPTTGTTTLPGTWRAMAYGQGRYYISATDTYFWPATLWLRIS